MSSQDDIVTFLLRELRIMAAAKADPEYDGTITLKAADALTILATFDRTAGNTRRKRGGDAGCLQDAAVIRAQRVGVLRRELKLTPGQPLDAAVLLAARGVLAQHRLKQANDTRLRGEISAAQLEAGNSADTW